VKVQYPGIAASIGADMRMIRALFHGLRLGTDLLPGSEIVERIMADIECKLAEEVDYTHEADQLRWFGAHASSTDILVPQPIASHSTRHVLTMQAVDGMHLDAWLATNPTQQARDRAGQLLFDWFLQSVFAWGRLHADPHTGNFLFLADGRIGVVDFGCTKTISRDFAAAVAESWRALLRRAPGDDCEALRRAYVGLAMISPNLSTDEFERELMPALAALQAWQIAPFRTSRFDFATRSPHPAFEAKQQRKIARYMTGFREEVPYFERTYLGINHMLKALGAQVSTENPWIN
jgi:predicted unusual protein kinase regulating ubiquinone biosynthesis (AarF/ABC1/UbiB family)